MSKILNELQKIFQNYFNDKNINLKLTTSSKNIKKWDSLAQVGLILAIEKKYKIKFSLMEIEKLRNVGDMINLLHKKIKIGK